MLKNGASLSRGFCSVFSLLWNALYFFQRLEYPWDPCLSEKIPVECLKICLLISLTSVRHCRFVRFVVVRECPWVCEDKQYPFTLFQHFLVSVVAFCNYYTYINKRSALSTRPQRSREYMRTIGWHRLENYNSTHQDSLHCVRMCQLVFRHI